MRSKMTLLVASAVLLAGSTAIAALIGVTPGFPKSSGNLPGGTTYVAATKAFSVSSIPNSTVFTSGAAAQLLSTTAPRSLAIGVRVENNGTLLGGVAGEDLRLTGTVTDPVTGAVYSGTLLTGEVTGFGFQDLPGALADIFQLRFQLTGGSMAPRFAGRDIGVSMTVDGGQFKGLFNANFTGGAKFDVGPVLGNGKIGDFVWHDVNRNGIQDTGEPGIDGIDVTLVDGLGNLVTTASTTTGMGQHGYYQFTGLAAGTYTVAVNESLLPSGFAPTTSLAPGSDATSDSNGSPTQVVLPEGGDNQTIDFGYVSPCTGSIGDYVWHDQNRNGLQDPGEPGLNGVTVNLLDASGALVATQVTNLGQGGATGYYRFTGLCAGTYYAAVDATTVPTGFTPTIGGAGGDGALDSNGSPTLVILTSDSASDPTVDFGFLNECTGRIGDFVWHDTDRDGIQDPDEKGVDGIVLRLTDPSGNVMTTSTGSGPAGQRGYYQFTGLCAGEYLVTMLMPTGFQASPVEASGDPTTDSNGNPTFVTILSDASSVQTIDFGINTPCEGMIGDFVWHDLDRDGVQDAGEPGIDGLGVRLKDAQGTLIAIATTGAGQGGQSGYYEFKGLCAGEYTICFEQPSGFVPTPPLASGDAATDSNGSPAYVLLPSDVAVDRTIDVGFNAPCTGSIGDFVWHDQNRDGIQDPGEPGIDNVTVRLKDEANNLIATATTGVGPGGRHGYYLFQGLCAETYTVEVSGPAGMTASPTGAYGSDPTNDSNVNPSQAVLSSDGASDTTVDFGFSTPCSGMIGNFVWNDLDRDGIQDAGEPGIDGVTVTLKDASGAPIATRTTGTGPADQHGYYAFDGLCAGVYTVEVSEPQGFVASPSGEGNDAASDSNGAPTLVVLTQDDRVDETIDFGFNTPCEGSIGDYVWHDQNRNGVQDPGEPGLDGLTVTLKNGAGDAIATAITGAGVGGQRGFFRFMGLCAGAYSVELTTPAGFEVSPTGAPGSNPANDSNGNPAAVLLTDDRSSDLTIDFGLLTPCTGAIGDFVWNDLDRDGIQDAEEIGLDGVAVTLKDANGAVIATTTTGMSPGGAHGYYRFTGLCAGAYSVEVVATPGFVASPSGAPGSSEISDSNAVPAYVILPTDDSTDDTIDFGFNTPCEGSIGDYVWHDLDRDGIQDAGEAGIDGVAIVLKNAAGTIIATTSSGTGPSGQHGYYTFQGLCSGVYVVEVVSPSGFAHSPEGQGSDPAADSNPVTSQVTLTTDVSVDSTTDFGFYTPCAGVIGDFVWSDIDHDGIQGSGEPGIDGVTVRLLDHAGTVIATAITGTGPANQHGYYRFTGLCAGTYVVSVVPPSGFESTTAAVGDDRTVDSSSAPATVVLATDNASDTSIDFGFFAACAGAIGDFVWHDVNRNGIQDGDEPGIDGVLVRLKDRSGLVLATAITGAGPQGQHGYYQFNGLCACAGAPTDDDDDQDGGCDQNDDGHPGGGSDHCAHDGEEGHDGDSGHCGRDGWYGHNGNNGHCQRDGQTGHNGRACRGSGHCRHDGEPGHNGNNGRCERDGQSGHNGRDGGRGHCERDGQSGHRGDNGHCERDGQSGHDGRACRGSGRCRHDGEPGHDGNNGRCGRDGQSGHDGRDGGRGHCSRRGQSGHDGRERHCQRDGQWGHNGRNGHCERDGESGHDGRGHCDRDGRSGHNGRDGHCERDGESGHDGRDRCDDNDDGNNDDDEDCRGDGSWRGGGRDCDATQACYFVEVAAPAGFLPTRVGAAMSNRTNDSNANPSPVSLPTDGSTDQSIDFGFVTPRTGSIGDFVWHDTDRDGLQEANEPGIDGVTVRLKVASTGAVIASTTTGRGPGGTHGYYQFSGLGAGSYRVVVTSPNGFAATDGEVGGDRSVDSDSNPASVTLADDASAVHSIDFGFVTPCTGKIGDYVWHDLDRDGEQGRNEPGIDGVTVRLRSPSGEVIATTTTRQGPNCSRGYYQFTGLCMGTYVVEAGTPQGFLPTTSRSSDATPTSDSNGSPTTVVLDSDGDTDASVDFGFMTACSGSIGDFVWNDLDADGLQGAGEPGIDGVTVTLKDAGGRVLATTTTHADPASGRHGFYLFDGLCSGCYYVVASTPEGFLPSSKNVGGDRSVDSNGSPAQVVLSRDDQDVRSVDFAFQTPCTGAIGNLVWCDMNRNGIQDAGEPGIEGAAVTLKNAATNAVVATANTNGSGQYAFTGLRNGSYKVEVQTPSGLLPTTRRAGSNRAIDSNDSPSTVTLDEGETDNSIDFGFAADLSQLCPPRNACGRTADFWKREAQGACGDQPIRKVSCAAFDSYAACMRGERNGSCVPVDLGCSASEARRRLCNAVTAGNDCNGNTLAAAKARLRCELTALKLSYACGISSGANLSTLIGCAEWQFEFGNDVAQVESVKNLCKSWNEKGGADNFIFRSR